MAGDLHGWRQCIQHDDILCGTVSLGPMTEARVKPLLLVPRTVVLLTIMEADESIATLIETALAGTDIAC
jgi:hypothetical protein